MSKLREIIIRWLGIQDHCWTGVFIDDDGYTFCFPIFSPSKYERGIPKHFAKAIVEGHFFEPGTPPDIAKYEYIPLAAVAYERRIAVYRREKRAQK